MVFYKVENDEDAKRLEELARSNGIALEEFVTECPNCGDSEFWNGVECHHCGYYAG